MNLSEVGLTMSTKLKSRTVDVSIIFFIAANVKSLERSLHGAQDSPSSTFLSDCPG